MLKLPEEISIYLSSKPVDMRKSIDGLSYLVLEELSCNPQDSAIYLFYNKAINKIKCLMWHKNGFILLYKRLEKGKFKITDTKFTNKITLSEEQLNWLLAGLDFNLMKEFNQLSYENYF